MAGVYISWPFCKQKCTYCNFASGVMPAGMERPYLEALLAEIGSHTWDWQPETLYFGGGTPGLLPVEALQTILGLLPPGAWQEATLEVAPGDLSPGLVRDWRRLGVNRVSLGVQSFVEPEIRRTGRKHTAALVERDVALLRQAGIVNLNIDLIAGLPGQNETTWRESLAWIERLRPPHVSIYMLEVDTESRLGLEILSGGRRYGAGELPSEEEAAGFYDSAVDLLAEIGIHRYEISNFAAPGFRSLHNQKYWRLEAYAGFGADAHSFDGRRRRQNVESAAEYVARWQQGASPCLRVDQARLDEERFFVGLRLLEGIQPTAQDWRRFAGPIHRFVEDGLLERDGDTLRLSRRGVMFSNEVFQEFVSC